MSKPLGLFLFPAWIKAYEDRGIEPTPEMWEKFHAKFLKETEGYGTTMGTTTTLCSISLSYNETTGEVDIVGCE